ncbi:MAG: hypothetical protein ACXW1B_03110 [Nitrososphaeraceae archaeon]
MNKIFLQEILSDLERTTSSSEPRLLTLQVMLKIREELKKSTTIVPPNLSPAEIERLAILAEEMGESIQAVGKILRHGYESYNPDVVDGYSNRAELERELGNVSYAIGNMATNRDVNMVNISISIENKNNSIKKYLHHN